jgi:hypothetical protein
LRAVLDKKMNRMEGWAERLERKAGDRFKPPDEGLLNHWNEISPTYALMSRFSP